MNVEEACRLIFNPATLEDARRRLRAAVYARFDELWEEAEGRRERPNQGVWDALERWKSEYSNSQRERRSRNPGAVESTLPPAGGLVMEGGAGGERL